MPSVHNFTGHPAAQKCPACRSFDSRAHCEKNECAWRVCRAYACGTMWNSRNPRERFKSLIH